MNQVRNIERLNQRELEAGIPIEASWHQEYKDSAYIFFGSLPYELNEGDVLVIFSQYGVPVHMKLVRDKETGKSKGFGWLKYEDQRSTILAVDNLNGAKVLGRIIRVDHAFYEERDYDEEYEELMKESLKKDFASDGENEAPPDTNTAADDEFADPLLLMQATDDTRHNEHRNHRSHRHRHREDKDKPHKKRRDEDDDGKRDRSPKRRSEVSKDLNTPV